MRSGGSQIETPGDRPRPAGRSHEGDRWLVEHLAGGDLRVTVDRGSFFVQHEGPRAAVRGRALRDVDPRDYDDVFDTTDENPPDRPARPSARAR